MNTTRTSLFTIESRPAGEGMCRPPGEWRASCHADTLEEAKTLEKKVYARGWLDTQIVANVEVVQRLARGRDYYKHEADRARETLQFIARHADCKPEVYKLAADALGWTREFTEIDRKRHFIGEAVQEALSDWWGQYGPEGSDTPPYELQVALSKAVTRSIPGEPWAERGVPGEVRSALSNSDER